MVSSLQDYIHFSLARHSFSLHRLRDAKLAFEHLLAHESAQTPPQQLQNLKEFIFVYRVSWGGEVKEWSGVERGGEGRGGVGRKKER